MPWPPWYNQTIPCRPSIESGLPWYNGAMHLTPIETALWAEHRDFFCPDGVPNDAVFEAYLSKYAANPHPTVPHAGHQNLIGVVLKHAPERAFRMGFASYYRNLRAEKDSPLFDDWLGDVAKARPDLLRASLKETAPLLEFTEQVMVLRDAKKWFPQDNIKAYAAPKLLKTKPTVVMKQFNPLVVDMPHLLAMSASLMAQDDAQCKTLGDTIARGCFIARYGMPPETDPDSFANDGHRPRPSDKYCTPAALGMLVDNGIAMEPADLLKQVQLRYKAISVVTDALAYPVRVFEDPQASQAHRVFAFKVLDTVLTDIGDSTLGTQVISALARIHHACGDASVQQRIGVQCIAIMQKNVGQVATILGQVSASSPELLDVITKHVLTQVPPKQYLDFYYATLLSPKPFHGKLPISCSIYDTRSTQAFLKELPASCIEPHVSHALQTVFKHHKPEERANELADVMRRWTQLAWSEEQRQVLVQSPLAATTILVYLYMAASGQRKYIESTHQSGVPDTSWAPLPLLEKFYPEKKPLWNQMKLGLLQMPIENSDAGRKVQYERVMASMFNVFSSAFLPDAPSFSIVHGMIQSLDASPLDYFTHIQKNTEPAMSFELPADMFDFN